MQYNTVYVYTYVVLFEYTAALYGTVGNHS